MAVQSLVNHPHTIWNNCHDTVTAQLSKGKMITWLLIQWLPHCLFLLLWGESYTFIRTSAILIRLQVSFCQDLKGSEDLSSTICSVQSVVLFMSISYGHGLTYSCLSRLTFFFMHSSGSGFQFFKIICCFLKYSLTDCSPSCKSQRNLPFHSVSYYVCRAAVLLLSRGIQNNDLDIFWSFQGKKSSSPQWEQSQICFSVEHNLSSCSFASPETPNAS